MAMDACGDSLQKQLEAPMKWIGMYIALASAICTLAMAADVFHGLKSRRLWFPCKYFYLNAAFLTLLAVAMKPPMDLSDQLYKDAGYLLKSSSLTFMCTAMTNFLSSVGSMNDHSIVTNTVALGILVLTLVGNISIQLVQLHCYFPYPRNIEFFHPTVFIVLLLLQLVSSAVAVQNIKRSLEMKYHQLHKAALMEDLVMQRTEIFTIANQKKRMKKYWVMAETSSLQYVMARSVVSTASSIICWVATFILGQHFSAHFAWMPIRGIVNSATTGTGVSAYKWSKGWILAIQSVGVFIGLVAPTLRWFNNTSYKYSTISYRSLQKEFNVENYWTQTLKHWRDNSLARQIRNDFCRNLFHGANWLVMNICIGVQIFVVLVSKLIVFVSVVVLTPFVACFIHIKKFLRTPQLPNVTNSNDHVGVDIGDGGALHPISSYVVLLEGEAQLPESTIKMICRQGDKVIETGTKRQPQALINFLRKSTDFRGVRTFDNVNVESLIEPEEPLNCWTLPLVTLTTVAIGLQNVANHKAKQLMKSVSEGMYLAELVDEASDAKGELANIRKAADTTWTGVALHHKWQDIDLRNPGHRRKNPKDILQLLSEKSGDIIRENPLNWSVRVIAANSMYRVCQTILLSNTPENEPTEEELFDRLSVMIADVFAACLTNLPHVIITMCHQRAIEQREKSVREAFLLLGKTEGILKILQPHGWPSMGPTYNPLYIDEWRAFFDQHDDENRAAASTSSSEAKTNQSSVEEISTSM